MRTKEELSAIKEEVENVSKKLQELTAEELKQVSCGMTEQELTEKAMKQQIDISGKDKQDLIDEMERKYSIRP